MSIPESPDEDTARRVAEVRDDVTQQFEQYFEPIGEGFEQDAGFGDNGVVTGTSSKGTFTFVRWRWTGLHTGRVSRFDGERPDDRLRPYFMAQGTGNQVTVEGLTVLEQRGEDVYARRFVDWLSVYSQMGIITPGRPIPRTSTELRDPPDPNELPEPRDRIPEDEPSYAEKTAPRAS
jgi:hypothetical protein